MTVSTDCPGIQVYTANFTDEIGKNGARYAPRSGVALETQFYPDSLHNPQWKQPITHAAEAYQSETVYRFYTV
jgi:aldose 1-epimerase